MRAWSVVLVMCACGYVAKPPEPDRHLAFQTFGSVFQSDRGYTFAVLPEAGTRAVRVDVRYPVGAAQDPPGKEGLAHLVEHLLFDLEFTQGDHKTSVAAELGRIALAWNAETDEDYTTYQTVVTPDQLDALIGIEASRMLIGCGGITPEIFARDREIVLDELRERQGTSGASIRGDVLAAIYPDGHPYRRNDSVETVSKLELKDVCEFLAGPYQQGTVIIAASGAVDDAELRKISSRRLGPLRRRAPPPERIPAPVDPIGGSVTIQADVDEPTLLVAWPLPAMSSADYRMLQLAWTMIATRLDSFAFMFHWGHDASATVIGGAYAPQLVVSIMLDSSGKLGDARDAVAKSAQFAAHALVTDSHDDAVFRRRTLGREASLIATWESLDGRDEMMEDYLGVEPNPDGIVGRLTELSTTSAAHARETVEHWLSPERARYVLLEPSGTPSVHAVANAFSPHAEHPGTAVDATLADRPLDAPAIPALAVERYQLDNGLRVVLWPDGQAPLANGRLVIAAGEAHDPAGAEGLAWLSGAETVDADTVVFEDTRLATMIDGVVNTLDFELREPGYGLSDDAKAYLKARLSAPGARARSAYRRDLFVAIYGEKHPYARSGMSAESIDKLHRDNVVGWARDHVVPANATLVLTGKFDSDVAKKWIAYTAAHVSSGTPTPPIAAPEGPPERRRVRGVDDRPSPTLELDVAFRAGIGIDRFHPQRLVLEAVLNAHLARLREREALTYGVSATYNPRVGGGYWLLSGDVDARRAVDAARELEAALDEVRRDPESYRAAFVLARQKVLDSILASTHDSSAIARRLVEFARFGLRDDYDQSLANGVAKLTLSEFSKFVTSELSPDGEVFGAFGNSGPVDAALAAVK